MAILKLNNGNYQARLQGADGHLLTKVFPTKRDAELQEMNWKREKREGCLGINSDRYRTLKEFYDEWFKDLVEQTPKDKRSGWRERQEQFYRDYIGPVLGHLRLQDIRPKNVRRVLIEMAKKGKAEQTRLHVFSMLRKMFGDAVEEYQYLTFNPALKKFRPEVPQKEARHLNLEQTKALLEHVKNKKYGLAIWIQLYMGLRVGELQALRWEDVDLQSGKLYIRRAFIRKTGFFKDVPKGGRQHSNSLPPELWEMLIVAKSKSTGEFVVTSLRGNMLPYREYLKTLGIYCKDLGFIAVGSHGLRHSTSEVYLSHGASRDDIRAFFAHSSLTVTERYLHGRDSNLEKVSNVIRLFEDGSTKNRPNSNVAVS